MASIVIVDDSRSVRLFLEKALQDSGHRVRSAGSGPEALRLLEAEAAEVLITDIYMPDGDGLELMIALRRRPHPPTVIAMSSNVVGPKSMLNIAQKLGAKIVLPKPFKAEELLAAIDQALADRSAPTLG
ncbi:MAG TPA: response regulator [Opitutaceae bacterium]|jgi:two-component system nitrogen regulation response regulator GlnG